MKFSDYGGLDKWKVQKFNRPGIKKPDSSDEEAGSMSKQVSLKTMDMYYCVSGNMFTEFRFEHIGLVDAGSPPHWLTVFENNQGGY